MPKVVVKLFGNADQAAKALSELKAKGYGPDQVGVLSGAHNKGAVAKSADSKEIKLDETGIAFVSGRLAEDLSKAKDVAKALAKLWEVPEETIAYYQSGVTHGSVAVSVHGPEDRLEEARKILRAASAGPSDSTKAYASSPAFTITSRMVATNPVDAKMTGDFRKY